MRDFRFMENILEMFIFFKMRFFKRSREKIRIKNDKYLVKIKFSLRSCSSNSSDK